MNHKTKRTVLMMLITLLLVGDMVLADLEDKPVNQGAMVTFRFDDGKLSDFDIVRWILAAYHFPATTYIITDPAEEGNSIGYMNWSQIEELQNLYGWEIGSHSKSHPDLTSLFDVELMAELKDSKKILEDHGLNVKSFALPYGYHDNKVLSYIARYYQSNGTAWPYGFNSYPFSDYFFLVQPIRRTTPVDTVKFWIDQAVAEGKWLVLIFHTIVEGNPDDYEYSRDNFEEIVKYVYDNGVPVVTVSEALEIASPNLISNPSFEVTTDQWADGWIRTDNNNIKIDRGNHGAYPESVNSLKFVARPDTQTAYTQDFIEIDSTKTYVLKIYLNCQEFCSGIIDVYIDEYNINGERIAMPWLTGIWNEYVGYKSVIYVPGQGVDKIRVVIKAVGDSVCYVDEVVFTDHNIIEDTNKPPIITSTPSTNAMPENVYVHDVDAVDDNEEDILIYSLIEHPVGMIIDSVTGLITWMPDQIGEHRVTVQVFDGLLSDEQRWMIVVGRKFSNLILNPEFELVREGWPMFWKGENSGDYIKVDTGSNRNSLKFIGDLQEKHSVYTEYFIDVKPGQVYLVGAHFNCQDFVSGGVDIFIDGHDWQGYWTGCREWKTGIWTDYFGYKVALFIPDQGVEKILLWIEVEKGSDLACFVNNVFLINIKDAGKNLFFQKREF